VAAAPDQPAMQQEQQQGLPPPIPAVIPPPIPFPDEEQDETAGTVHNPEVAQRILEAELLKMDIIAAGPVIRQSSIFKLLSPPLPSSATSAGPSRLDHEPSIPSTSQDAQAEVEAMI
jgi:hypothetical protein